MRLLTFEVAGRERLGAEWNGNVVDLQNAGALRELITSGASGAAAFVERFPSCLLAFLKGGDEARKTGQEILAFLEALPADAGASLAGSSAIVYTEEQIRRRAPLPRPGKILCIGLNYRDHAEESGLPVPKEPVIFTKYGNTVIGPEDPIVLPPDSEEVDYEAELVFVMGKTAKNVPAEQAMEYVAGVTVGHDVSARDYQIKRGGGQWTVGKTWDTFAPMGPVLVTLDEGIDPHNLGIRCLLNGNTMQDSNTNQFVFDIPAAVAYISRIMTLEPGDCVFTGTPPGVGFARKPPVFLKAGDVAEIQIDGIGNLRNPVVGAS